jgi:hypothetical protein
MSVNYNYLNGDTPLEFAKRFDKQGYGFYDGYSGTSAAGKMFPKEPSLPDRMTRETMPNTARYYGLPILPHPSAKTPPGMKVVKLAEVRTDAAVKRGFDALYPADPCGSTAYAVEVDDSFFVLNGHENTDTNQRFKMKLDSAGLRFMEGGLPFQNLIFGKRHEPGRYWFQTNGYHGDGSTPGQRCLCPAKPTVITFMSDSKPAVSVEDGKETSMTVAQPWDASTKTLTLRFDHAQGAVSFRIESGPGD